jgi:hypothetical protein
MDEFFCIKLVNNRTGERGYIMDDPKGRIMISMNKVLSDVKKFAEQKHAQEYIKVNKLNRQGVEAFVRSNQDLITDEAGVDIKPLEDRMAYYIENELGEKLYFRNTINGGYYFEKGTVGFCVFEEHQAIELINIMKIPATVKKLQ